MHIYPLIVHRPLSASRIILYQLLIRVQCFLTIAFKILKRGFIRIFIIANTANDLSF